MPLGPVIAGMRYKISIQSELVESRACVRLAKNDAGTRRVKRLGTRVFEPQELPMIH